MKLSLTKKRRIILNYTHDVVRANSDKSNFAFADSNGNLKIRIVEPLNRKSFFSFKDTDKLHALISKFLICKAGNPEPGGDMVNT